jgi:uncharacterized protein
MPALDTLLARLRGQLRLLIVQPTPFCNLACDYCYLPDRNSRRRIAPETLDTAIRKLFEAGLPASEMSVIWHAGEPLVLPPSFYEVAFEICARHASNGTLLRHHFQTNATLIDDRWCRLFARPDVQVGVSIDGPAWLHDTHRKDRRGRGTHATVMAGVNKLREHGIRFHVICVVTRNALPHPDAVFDFFHSLGSEMLCLNVEEQEGIHASSSLKGIEAEDGFRRFFSRILERARTSLPMLRIREVEAVLSALRDPQFGKHRHNGQNKPGVMLSIGHDGSFTTFSPELLGMVHPAYGDFNLGNVLRDDFVQILRGEKCRSLSREIEDGVLQCEKSCRYFAFCRGGAPVNKLAELGTFRGTETMFCRLTQQAVVDCVLERLDLDLRHGTNALLTAAIS